MNYDLNLENDRTKITINFVPLCQIKLDQIRQLLISFKLILNNLHNKLKYLILISLIFNILKLKTILLKLNKTNLILDFPNILLKYILFNLNMIYYTMPKIFYFDAKLFIYSPTIS